MEPLCDPHAVDQWAVARQAEAVSRNVTHLVNECERLQSINALCMEIVRLLDGPPADVKRARRIAKAIAADERDWQALIRRRP